MRKSRLMRDTLRRNALLCRPILRANAEFLPNGMERGADEKKSCHRVKVTGSLLDSNYTISGGRAPKRVLNNKFAAKG